MITIKVAVLTHLSELIDILIKHFLHAFITLTWYISYKNIYKKDMFSNPKVPMQCHLFN
jgi:hypothetical protein